MIGSGKLDANGKVGVYCTRDMPWQASLHQLYLRAPSHLACNVTSRARAGVRPEADGGQRGRVGAQSCDLVGHGHAADYVGCTPNGGKGGVAYRPRALRCAGAKVRDLKIAGQGDEEQEGKCRGCAYIVGARGWLRWACANSRRHRNPVITATCCVSIAAARHVALAIGDFDGRGR